MKSFIENKPLMIVLDRYFEHFIPSTKKIQNCKNKSFFAPIKT